MCKDRITDMSPLTLERIKKAKGQVKITEISDPQKHTNVMKFGIQIMENGAWVTIFTDHSRQICEQTVRKAASQVILG
ncbi:MAG: hypothetical protein ACXAB4_02420 [Candidatus Hodarchaeales archaeon]